MAQEITFAIIKPDAVAGKHSGAIISRIEDAGFNILGMAKILMPVEVAQELYKAHKERPFYQSLVDFMTARHCIVMALEKENAIEEWRNLMGATDPAEAAPGTIRKDFGISLDEGNATHGSDSPEGARFELELFFGQRR